MFRNNYNIEYSEWDSAIDQQKPLDMVHMYHNIPEFKEKISGTSVGYIYQVDVSSIKNDLQTYTTDDQRYELVYKGTDNLPITGSIPIVFPGIGFDVPKYNLSGIVSWLAASVITSYSVSS